MNGIHFHKRNLPHLYIPERTYFITFRVKDSLPESVIKRLKNSKPFNKIPRTKLEKYKTESLFFNKMDILLSLNKHHNYLKSCDNAEIITKQICKLDKKDYNLIAYTIMPNHVHLLFTHIENKRSIDKIMQEIKRISAFYINRNLNKSGSFWQSESYDHIVRNEDEFYNIIRYIIMNPVKAKFVDKWQDWKHTYISLDVL